VLFRSILLNDAAILDLQKQLVIGKWYNLIFYIANAHLWIFLNGKPIIIEAGQPLAGFRVADCRLTIVESMVGRILAVRKLRGRWYHGNFPEPSAVNCVHAL
jgi:hypothetical protein